MKADFSWIIDPLQSEKRLANRYIAGLLVILLLAGGANLIMDQLLRAQEKAAETIELASRQRMLSQRITQLAYRYVLADSPHESNYIYRNLDLAIREMRQSHEELLKHAPSRIYAEVADPIYFDAPYRLDMRVRGFLGAAEGLLAHDPGSLDTNSPYLEQLREREGSLVLEGLGLAVERYVEQAGEAMRHLRWMLWALFGMLLLTVLLLGAVIFRPAFVRLVERAQELYLEAETDVLTGSHNRRGFLQRAEALHGHVKRREGRCTLLALDIDHFKAINDAYGHQAGDQMLAGVVEACAQHLRQPDVLGRLGGEEFAVLLPGVAPDIGMKVAEKLRRLVQDLEVDIGTGTPLGCTVSIGVTELRAQDETPAVALARADAALYRAKAGGRNRVLCTTSQDEPD